MNQNWLASSWQVLVARGVLAALFGIMAMVWPLSTALALVTLWGIWAAVDGIGSLVQAFTGELPGVVKAALAVMGVVALFAAAFAIFHPVRAGVTLAWILGLWLMARGILELVLAFSHTPPAPRGLLIVSAVMDGLLGILFVANPGAGALSLTVLFGTIALVWGIVFIVVGLQARRETETPAAPLAS